MPGDHSAKTVPLDLAVKQIDAYQYAFLEAVRCANEAIKQRDYYHEVAVRATCKLMSSEDACPDDEDDPCPLFFGGCCKTCRDFVDKRARYL